jgi:hypothetical protein
MKVLVATKEMQGARSNDFCWAKVGEYVTFPSECSNEEVDGNCGCRRSMSGVSTHKSTTTVKVVNKHITTTGLAKALAAGLVNAGWYPSHKAALPHAAERAKELAEIAKAFPVGTVLERREGLKVRQVNPTK